jgi:hypothetical protein
MGGQESALQVYGHADFPRTGELLAFPGGGTILIPNRLGMQSGERIETNGFEQKEGRLSPAQVQYHVCAICVDAQGTEWEVRSMRATPETFSLKRRPLPQDVTRQGAPVLSLQQVLDWAVAGRACSVVAEGSGVFTINI